MKVGDSVWKSGHTGGYEGPGVIVAVFKNWMGQNRYVVGHQIEGGRGLFYHIYSDRELTAATDDERDRARR
jgi:hypothetical protein